MTSEFRGFLGRVQKLKPSKKLAYQARELAITPPKNSRIEVPEQQTQAEDLDAWYYLHEDSIDKKGSADKLQLNKAGLDKSAIRKLKNFQPPYDYALDLHGYTILEAREAIRQEIHQAQKRGSRHLQIIHGKSNPVYAPIKSFVFAWLERHPQILACYSLVDSQNESGVVNCVLKRIMNYE